jgi:hypothetical protein
MLRTSPPFAEDDAILGVIRAKMVGALGCVNHPFEHSQWTTAETLQMEAVHRLRLPLTDEGVVATVVATQGHFLGPLPKTQANVRLLKALGGGVPRSAFVVPILALGRVVNVLYADNGRGELVDPTDLGELLILATRIAQGYDALARRAV